MSLFAPSVVSLNTRSSLPLPPVHDHLHAPDPQERALQVIVQGVLTASHHHQVGDVRKGVRRQGGQDVLQVPAADPVSLALVIERLPLPEEGRAAVEARLHDRVAEISAELPVDQAMLAQEIVRAAARSDISEEVTRFRAHLAHWAALADGPEPCGRKLDFLLQEMNREINTIGSKADGVHISELIITAKAELEKMREQVQNVE